MLSASSHAPINMHPQAIMEIDSLWGGATLWSGPNAGLWLGGRVSGGGGRPCDKLLPTLLRGIYHSPLSGKSLEKHLFGN